MYLTYERYQTMGGTLSSAAFERQEMRAGHLIRQMTHNRLEHMAELPDAVEYAAFDLIAALSEDEANGGKIVQSVSNDGVSVTYRAGDDPDELRGRCSRIVRDWLGDVTDDRGVLLLYAGVAV